MHCISQVSFHLSISLFHYYHSFSLCSHYLFVSSLVSIHCLLFILPPFISPPLSNSGLILLFIITAYSLYCFFILSLSYFISHFPPLCSNPSFHVPLFPRPPLSTSFSFQVHLILAFSLYGFLPLALPTSP